MRQGYDMAILVVSCDKYADLWDIFFTLFDRYWSDCPYSVYLGTNTKIYNSVGRYIKTITIGEDKSWADNTAKMLEQIRENYVIMFLEDFFIDKSISTKDINDRLVYVIEQKLDCLRLNPCPPPCNIVDKRMNIGDVECGSPYYIATQPAIWRKSSLVALMKSGYSAWDFEIENSKNAEKLNMKIAGTNRYIISHKNGVERGQFYLRTLKFLEKENIIIEDVNKRGVIDNTKFSSYLKIVKYRLKEWINIKMRLYRLNRKY